MPATIRKGSKGNDVKTWQGVIGAKPVDGIFGVGTEQATKNWQKSKGLVADGIVGPASWAAAGYGTTTTATAPKPATVAAPKPAATPYVAPKPAATPYVAPKPAVVQQPAAGAYGIARPGTASSTSAKPVASFLQTAPPVYVPPQIDSPTGSISIPTSNGGSVNLSTTGPKPTAWIDVPKNRQMLLFGGIGAGALLTMILILTMGKKNPAGVAPKPVESKPVTAA